MVSWGEDPWLALEVAWRDLPPPTTDIIRLGHDDYGAVRGFLYPRGGDPRLTRYRLEWNRYERLGQELPPEGPHRWSCRRAWLRLKPKTAAARYKATLWMGYAFPATRTEGRVAVRAKGGARFVADVGRDVRAFSFTVAPAHDGVIEVRLDAPTWSRSGEPADQGVRVDRFEVQPPE
jgi:hypothetical protein